MADRQAGKNHDPVPAGTPTPNVKASVGSFLSARAGVAVCFAYEGRRATIPDLPANSSLRRTLERLMRDGGLRGRCEDCLLWPSGGRYPATRYMVVGLGKRPLTASRLHEACGMAANRVTSLPGGAALRMSLLVPPAGPMEEMARLATEGLCLGSYRMTKYMSNGHGSAALRTVDLLVPRQALREARQGVDRGRIRAGATNMARDIVNEPAMVLTPLRMAATARRIAKGKGLKSKVLERRDLERMGMGAMLGVSAGSAQPPCLVHLVYRPRGSAASSSLAKIALVGKGITFDSGGLSLKSSSGMETMKLDKAGASTVLGVMSVLPDLDLPVEVHGIMAMAENMPSGSAIKPGDILKSHGGQSIEVLNTDAEGRLVLADALSYAQAQGVDRIIDLATLTGACMVALGSAITGVFGNNQEFIDAFLEAAGQAGEKMWQLPLEEEYRDQIRSHVADIRNTSTTRYGGAITAGLFLKHFVDDKIPWIHLDIAGPAFLEREHRFMRKGATGAAARTILTYLATLSA